MEMEKKSPLRDLMDSTMEKVHEMVDANNIVGAPTILLASTISRTFSMVEFITSRSGLFFSISI